MNDARDMVQLGESARDKGLAWIEASGKLRCDRMKKLDEPPASDDTCSNCLGRHHLYTQNVPFSGAVVAILVSVLSEEESTFITGLELVYDDPTLNILLGYRVSGMQFHLSLREESLTGFETMVGEGGIHAIRPYSNTNHSWLGKVDGETQKFVRISTEKEILAFSGHFDVREAQNFI